MNKTTMTPKKTPLRASVQAGMDEPLKRLPHDQADETLTELAGAEVEDDEFDWDDLLESLAWLGSDEEDGYPSF